MNIDPSFAPLEQDTKLCLAERFAASWVDEDKTTELTTWSKKIIDNTDSIYNHIDETTPKKHSTFYYRRLDKPKQILGQGDAGSL